jgi:hypothetical protein
MRKLKISIIFFTIFFLQFSCSETTNLEVEQKTNIFPKGTEFQGTGMGWNQAKSIWSLSILENDSILLIEKDVRDSAGIHNINIQYFGEITKSIEFSHELLISNSISGSGCNKPGGQYLDTDTIPIYIDSILIENSPIWELSYLDTTIKIKSTYSRIVIDSKLNTSFLLTPDSISGYKPMTLSTGNRCAIVINLGGHNKTTQYFLNIENGIHQLIIRDNLSIERYGSDCSTCMKIIELTRLQ